MILPFVLCRRLQRACHIRQHIFNKDPVPDSRIIYHNVRHRADELAVLNDGAARHECGQ